MRPEQTSRAGLSMLEINIQDHVGNLEQEGLEGALMELPAQQRRCGCSVVEGRDAITKWL